MYLMHIRCRIWELFFLCVAACMHCRSIKEYCVSQPAPHTWMVGLAKDLCIHSEVENEKCSYRCRDCCGTVLMFILILISFLL